MRLHTQVSLLLKLNLIEYSQRRISHEKSTTYSLNSIRIHLASVPRSFACYCRGEFLSFRLSTFAWKQKATWTCKMLSVYFFRNLIPSIIYYRLIRSFRRRRHLGEAIFQQVKKKTLEPNLTLIRNGAICRYYEYEKLIFHSALSETITLYGISTTAPYTVPTRVTYHKILRQQKTYRIVFFRSQKYTFIRSIRNVLTSIEFLCFISPNTHPVTSSLFNKKTNENL